MGFFLYVIGIERQKLLRSLLNWVRRGLIWFGSNFIFVLLLHLHGDGEAQWISDLGRVRIKLL